MNLLAVQTMAKREPFQGGLEVRGHRDRHQHRRGGEECEGEGEGKEKGARAETGSYNYAE